MCENSTSHFFCIIQINAQFARDQFLNFYIFNDFYDLSPSLGINSK